MDNDPFSVLRSKLNNMYQQYSFDFAKDIAHTKEMWAHMTANKSRTIAPSLHNCSTIIRTYKDMVNSNDTDNMTTSIPSDIQDIIDRMNCKMVGNYKIHPIVSQKNNDNDARHMECAVLTSGYKRCKNEVKCICNGYVTDDGDIRNINLCTLHLNTLSKDPTNKRPFVNGLYFESDLYADEQ